MATPAELAPKKPLLDWIRTSGAAITLGTDPEEAVKGADCVVTDTWVSMGNRNGSRRHNLLKRYQVNGRLMARAKSDAILCTACLRIAVRKSPTRSWMVRIRWFSTRPKTGCTHKRAY